MWILFCIDEDQTHGDHGFGPFLPRIYTFLPGYNVYRFGYWRWLIDDLVYEGDEAFKLQISLVNPQSQPNVVIGKQHT